MSVYLCPRCCKPTEMQTGIYFEDGEQHFDYCAHTVVWNTRLRFPMRNPSHKLLVIRGLGNVRFAKDILDGVATSCEASGQARNCQKKTIH